MVRFRPWPPFPARWFATAPGIARGLFVPGWHLPADYREVGGSGRPRGWPSGRRAPPQTEHPDRILIRVYRWGLDVLQVRGHGNVPAQREPVEHLQLVVEITGRRERYAPAGRNARFRRLVLVPQRDVISGEVDPLVRTRVTELDACEALVRVFRLVLSV